MSKKSLWEKVKVLWYKAFHLSKARQNPSRFKEALREFVYLDEVSVYSLLASRKEGITTEFTKTQTQSWTSKMGSSVGVGFGGIKPSLNTNIQEGHVQGAQVLSKANIQTNFKELYETEKGNLKLCPPCADCIPKLSSVEEITQKLETLIQAGWVVDPGTFVRGDLLEIKVELEADLIFRLSSVISTIYELMADKDQIFGQMDNTQLSQMLSITRALEGLLAGLVPIRGRLMNYKTANVGNREVLIHRSLLEQMPKAFQSSAYRTFVVGVAERELFWKDIRRVLFSQARYTVFCRLGVSGLTDRWQPIKTANILTGIVPDFDKAIGDFSKIAHQSMQRESPDTPLSNLDDDSCLECEILHKFATMLACHHGKSLAPNDINNLLVRIPRDQNWMETIDNARPVLEELRKHLDTMLEVDTSRETASKLRMTVLRKIGHYGEHDPDSFGRVKEHPKPASTSEKFLDTEIVAIYW